MASLHASLYHGLLFFGLFEVFGIHLLDMSRREVRSAIESEEFSNFSGLILSTHNDIFPNWHYFISILSYDRS